MEQVINKLPNILIEKIDAQYNNQIKTKIFNGYIQNRIVSLRINTLKTNINSVCKTLKENNIEFEEVPWNTNALVIKSVKEQDIKKLSIYEEGQIYLQSLSSMLPPIILEPLEGKDILDMTAAPGGKTTQMAAMTNNKANITACEMNNIRIEKLKYNIVKQGATSVSILQADSRNLDNYFAFDQILLDAPCSGSGTITITNEKTYKNFTKEALRKLTLTQLALLKKALTILKSGQEMVYSTCSILSEENEEIIQKVLKEVKAHIIPIKFDKMETIPTLPSKIEGTLCICPNEYYEGFFIAKIKKD